MCLTVKKEVKTLVKKCKKKLKINLESVIVTPYQEVHIPYNGLLIPDKHNRFPDFDKYVYDGYIHAYTNKKVINEIENTDIHSGLTRDNNTFYLDAYAIWTVALGLYDDLICKALYIPKLDLTERRDIRVSMFENRYNKERLIKEFGIFHVLGDY